MAYRRRYRHAAIHALVLATQSGEEVASLHGFAHGSELPASASPAAYACGFVLASGLLHAAGIALGLLRELPRGDAVLRALGAVTGAAGLWMLAGRLA